jgi:hypothetical protein
MSRALFSSHRLRLRGPAQIGGGAFKLRAKLPLDGGFELHDMRDKPKDKDTPTDQLNRFMVRTVLRCAVPACRVASLPAHSFAGLGLHTDD